MHIPAMFSLPFLWMHAIIICVFQTDILLWTDWTPSLIHLDKYNVKQVNS